MYLNKIKQFVTKILPYDKILHFTFGVFLSLIFYNFFAWWQSLLITLSLAIIIELYDKLSKKGTPEILDIIYTVMGGGSVIVLDLLKKIAYAIFN